ncbi:polymorphic toxin type 27 domain-containing protein, partial [Actinoplanes sp. ATCC 53533]|uniref:polymorphic toxin type 27 domain-containing protein n=1 Tax=Actinoplanes sp. ATCC 53533 TaxID=1288362 RepID=UPI0011D0B3D7
HPFWAPDLNKWVNAGELTSGAMLKTGAGTHVQITAVKKWTAQTQRVHNLTVDGLHTYYVAAGDASVLTHNCGKSSTGGVDYVDTDGCSNVCMGVNPHSDDLASAVGGHTFNGPAWSGTNTASGRPLWMEGISTVARSGNIRISFSLDGLFGAGGRTVAGSAEEAFSANYARGLPMVADWKLGAGRERNRLGAC